MSKYFKQLFQNFTKENIAAFDTEFFHYKWDMTRAKLCQLAATTGDFSFNRYIRGHIIEEGSFLDGKISQNQLDDGVDECQALQDFVQFIQTEKITGLVGHNPINDAKLLHYTAQKCQMKLPKLKIYDTCDLCRIVDSPKGCSLSSFYQRHFNEFKNAHNALNDAEMTLELFNKFKPQLLFTFVIGE